MGYLMERFREYRNYLSLSQAAVPVITEIWMTGVVKLCHS